MRLTGNWTERFYALILIGSIEFISSYLLPYSPRNELYYMFCGAFNAITLSILVTRFRYTLLARDLFQLTVIQSGIQLLGISLYFLAKIFPITRELLPVSIYNDAIYIIVVVTFLRIIIVRDGDESAARKYRRGLFGIRRSARVSSTKGAK